MSGVKQKKTLAISTCGGHWVQLNRLLPALDGTRVVFAVTKGDAYRSELGAAKFYSVTPATRWNKIKLVRQALEVFWIVLRERPQIVVSTGSAPGVFAVLFAKLFFNAKTVWVDSIANFQSMSLSGRIVRPFADLWLTQWPHLAAARGPHYRGSVL